MAGFDPAEFKSGPPFGGWTGDAYSLGAGRAFVWSPGAVPVMAVPEVGGYIDGVSDLNGNGIIGFMPGLPVRVQSGAAFGVNALLQVNSTGQFVPWMGVGRVVARALEAATASGQTKSVAFFNDDFSGFEFGLQSQGGLSIFVGAGTPETTPSGTGSIANQADSSYIQCATGAVSGTFAGIDRLTQTGYRRTHNPEFRCLLRTGADITSIVFYAGLSTAHLSSAGVLTSAHAMIRYLAGTDGGWVGTVAGGAQSVSATILAIAASSAYFLRIRIDDGGATVFVSVNGSAEVGMTVNLPGAATDMGWVAGAKCTTASSRNVLMSRVRCRLAS